MIAGPVALLFALKEEAVAVSQHRDVVIAVTGVGKVNAAMTTQSVIHEHRPRAVIVMGVAGAVEDGEAGQVIVASGAIQHDFDARPLTGARGELPGVGALVRSDDRITRALRAAVPKARFGVVLTGDQIVTSREMRDRIASEFPEGVCLDMETAAVAQVAHANRLPWAALRITSDAADESFNLEAVLGFGARTASEFFENVLRAVLPGL